MKPWSDPRIILHHDKAMSCCPLTTVHECTYRMIAWKSAAIFRIIPLSNFNGSCHRLQDKICLQDLVMLCLHDILYVYIHIYVYERSNFYTEDADSPRHVFMTMTESVWTNFGPVPFVIETFRLSLILGESPRKLCVNWRFPATSHLAPLHLSLIWWK